MAVVRAPGCRRELRCTAPCARQARRWPVRRERVIVARYGGPDELRVVEEECPEPKRGCSSGGSPNWRCTAPARRDHRRRLASPGPEACGSLQHPVAQAAEAGTLPAGFDGPVRPPPPAEDQATRRAALSARRGQTGTGAARAGRRDRQDCARVQRVIARIGSGIAMKCGGRCCAPPLKPSVGRHGTSRPRAAKEEQTMNATERFTELQRKSLAFHSANATSRFIDLEKPRMRAHVLEAGTGDPVVFLHGGDGEAVNFRGVRVGRTGTQRGDPCR